MTARREVRTSPKTGRVREFWIVDFLWEHPNGRKERIRRVSPTQSQRGAEAYERQLAAELRGDPSGEKGGKRPVPTLTEFADEFIKSYVVPHNKPSEQHNKRMHLRLHLLPFFGPMKLTDIRPRDIDRYKSHKLELRKKNGAQRYSPKTINLHLSTLRRALYVAQEWEIIDDIPMMRRLKEEKSGFRFLDFSEADRLIAAADPEWRTMIVVALKTGMRLGELLALRWADVDLVTGRVMVRRNYVRGHVGTPKNGKAREIPLCDDAIAALTDHPTRFRGGLVFCNKKGDFLTKEMSKHPLWRACKRAGLPFPHLGWHALRHSFASHLAMRGATAKAIQELLGHSTIEMTNRYMHLSPDARREAVQLLNSVGSCGNTMAIQGVGKSNQLN